MKARQRVVRGWKERKEAKRSRRCKAEAVSAVVPTTLSQGAVPAGAFRNSWFVVGFFRF